MMKLFFGPNQYSAHDGVLFEFEIPSHLPVSLRDIQPYLQKIFGTTHALFQSAPDAQKVELPELLIEVLTELYEPKEIYKDVFFFYEQDEKTKKAWIFLRGQCFQHSASFIVKSAFDLSNLIVTSIENKDIHLDKIGPPVLADIKKKIIDLLPDDKTQMMMSVATSKDIPFYSVAKSGSVWQFGQGTRGKHYWLGANENDSMTGEKICHNKVLANEFIKQLGLPGVEHGVAKNREQAHKIADHIGYPVVVKPISQSRGTGVTAAIENPEELENCLNVAFEKSSNALIIERHMFGPTFRLAVIGGKVEWVFAGYPARVFGDGENTVSGLIEIENTQRKKGSIFQEIEVTDALESFIKKKGSTLETLPQKGEEIQLSSIAHYYAGGTGDYVAKEDVHPDNDEMAISIAKALRMDAIGIDFIITDISKSWRELPCAVVEVNQTPGIAETSNAESVLHGMLPKGSDGRIPSILILDGPNGLGQFLENKLKKRTRGLGYASPLRTSIDDVERGKKSDLLSLRVQSLILNPSCRVILVVTSSKQIEKEGFPLQRFDLIIGPEGLSRETINFLQDHSKIFHAFNDEDIHYEKLEDLVDDLNLG